MASVKKDGGCTVQAVGYRGVEGSGHDGARQAGLGWLARLKEVVDAHIQVHVQMSEKKNQRIAFQKLEYCCTERYKMKHIDR